MTVIKNQLVDSVAGSHPMLVTARLKATSGFLGTGQSEVVVSASVSTSGLWSMDLIPTSSFEDPAAYYEIREGNRVWSAIVPDTGEHWLREVLTDPPVPGTAVLGLTQAQGDARYQQTSAKGAASGYAGLDGTGKVPISQLPPLGGQPSGAAGGDLAGSYPNPVVASGAVTPAKLDRAYSTPGHTHPETDISGLIADLVSVTSRLDALESTPAGGGIKGSASSGLILTQTTIAVGPGWTVLPTPYRVTIPAVVGDVLVFTSLLISTQNNGDVECDVASIVSGAPARYLSSGTASQASNGHGGLYGGTGLSGFNSWQPLPVTWVVQAGDISGGNVTLTYVGRTNGAGRVVGSGAYPSQLDVVNHGAP